MLGMSSATTAMFWMCVFVGLWWLIVDMLAVEYSVRGLTYSRRDLANETTE